MAARYRNGSLRPSAASNDQLARLGEQVAADYRTAMDHYRLHDGAAHAYRLIDAANEFIAATAPWAMAKDPAQHERLTQVLFDVAEAIRLAAILLLPVMPRSAREILRRVGASPDARLDVDGTWRTQGERVLEQGGPLWPRKESTIVTDIKEPLPGAPRTPEPRTPEPGTPEPGTPEPGTRTAPSTPAPGTAEPTSRISIDDFMKVELRVAKVLAAEKVEKSKKLLKLSVDVGTEQRTLVAGIAEAYDPAALVGKTVVIVFNLKPAKLMGIESNGMVLAASPEGGAPEVVTFANPPAPGTRVR
jgi:methionyl-tRNA synthetase